MTQPPEASAELIARGVVPVDLECRSCGYNLRTLAWSAHCPECATPVEASRLPGGMPFASFREAWRCLRALQMLLISTGCLTAMNANTALSIFIFRSGPPWLVSRSFLAKSSQGGMCLGLIACVFQVLSCTMLLRRFDRHKRSVLLLRLAILLTAVGLLAFLPWQGFVTAWIANRSLRFATAVPSANFLFMVCEMVGLVIGISWIKSACKFGDLELDGPLFWARFFLVATTIFAALAGLGIVVLALFGSLRPPASGGVTGQFPPWQRLIMNFNGFWRTYMAMPFFVAATSALWVASKRFHRMLSRYPRSQKATPCRT